MFIPCREKSDRDRKRFEPTSAIWQGELPRILRRAGTNDGATMILARTQEEVSEFMAANAGSDIFSIAFQDYRSDDGYYRKARIRMIDGRAYPIHLYASKDNWCVHSTESKIAFKENPALLEAEAEFLGNPLESRLEKILQEIHARLGLEIYGIDLGLMPDGS